MRKDSLLSELKADKNMEENLGKFSDRLMGLYHEYALIDFTMNYFTFYEIVKGKENPEVENIASLTAKVNAIIKEAFIECSEPSIKEGAFEELLALRQLATEKMEILTAYTDCVQIYEYVLNRLELSFGGAVPDIDERKAANEILQYIFDTKDNVVINDKIKEILGQLPIRMTKSRYFDLLSNSLTVYKGAERSSVDGYVYMLRTSAMLYRTEAMKEDFIELGAFAEKLRKVDYRNLDQGTYLALCAELQKNAKFIRHMVDAYVLLVTLVNNLSILMISNPYSIDHRDEVETACMDIIKEINDNFSNDQLSDIKEETQGKLILTEGIQEQLSYDFMEQESVLYDLRISKADLIDRFMLGKKFDGLLICQKLVSSSLFIALEDTAVEGIADERYIAQTTNDLIEEMKALFKGQDISVTRSIMANTMNKMPVLFQNTNEVGEYIINSLEQCGDKAEKAVCLSLIKQLME